MTRAFGQEWVTREDMVMFINACFACSGQHEFYSSAGGSAVSIEFLHEYILGNYRQLYARSLAAGINHFNSAQIILNLLATGAATPAHQRAEEGELIYRALAALPPQRGYRVLSELRARSINNRRARAITRRYLGSRPDLAFEAVKYRKKVRAALVHAHARAPGELSAFLFRGWQERRFTTPLFESFRQAHYAEAAIYELPFTISEGLAAKHGVPRDVFLAKIDQRLTVHERLRLQKAAQREAVELDVDLGRLPLTKLALYILSLSPAQRGEQHARLQRGLDDAARRVLRRTPRRLGKVAAVLDRSYSSSGSTEKRRRPLGVALAVSTLLRAAAAEYRALWTTPVDDEVLVTPSGQTGLAGPLVDAIEWGAELIVIVSDGFENDPPRGAAEVARVFRARLDRQRATSIVHVNPVFDAEHYSPRTIGPAIPTVGLRDAEDLFTMLGFARFADGTAPLSDLEEYLAQRVKLLLGERSTDAEPMAEPAADVVAEAEA
jgi:hypothetical protein